MTVIVTPTSIDLFTDIPLQTDTRAEFNTAAFTTVGQWNPILTQTNTANQQTYQNAVAANERAVAANEAASAASGSAGTASGAATAAATSAAAALSAAQAAQGAAGLPASNVGYVLVGIAGGLSQFVDPSGLPALQAKLNRDLGSATRLVTPYIPHADTAAGGTEIINVALGSTHKLKALGNVSLQFDNMPAGEVSTEIVLLCENFGGKIIAWPTGNWVKADGSLTSSVGNSGVTWQTVGIDRVCVMIDNGQITYKVMR